MNENHYNRFTINQKWYPRLKLFAVSYVKDENVAEDLVQDTIVKLLEMSPISNPSDSSLGCLSYTILRNKCLDYLRHRTVEMKHKESLMDDYEILLANKYALEDDSIRIITDNQIKEILNVALQKLPNQTRKVFVMNKFKDLKYREVADELSISVKTVEYHISKAISILRKELGKYYGLISFLYFY